MTNICHVSLVLSSLKGESICSEVFCFGRKLKEKAAHSYMFILEEPGSRRCILHMEQDMTSVRVPALGEFYDMVLHCPLWNVCPKAQVSWSEERSIRSEKKVVHHRAVRCLLAALSLKRVCLNRKAEALNLIQCQTVSQHSGERGLDVLSELVVVRSSYALWSFWDSQGLMARYHWAPPLCCLVTRASTNALAS